MITIEFPAPAERLNLNNKKLHWAKKAKIVAAWRQAACVHAKNAQVKNLKPSLVKVTFLVGVHRRRDGHNMAPTVKACVDGLVDAKCWPDDNGDWVAIVDPTFEVVGNKSPRKDWVRIEIKEIPS